MAKAIQHISLEFDPYIPWCQGVLRGIEAFAKTVPDWRLLRHRMIPGPRVWLKDAEKRIDGILSTGEKDWAKKSGIPLVRFLTTDAEPGFPVVNADYLKIGRLAARNLIENGYKALALIKAPQEVPQDLLREEGFCRYGAEEKAEVYRLHQKCSKVSELLNDPKAARELMQAIDESNQPVGLFARNLREAYVLYSLILESGLQIPEEVGLIVGGNDRAVLASLQPPITSVGRNSYEIGYKAAETLQKMLAGQPVETMITVPPAGIVDRGSTRLQAIGDKVVQRARTLIRERIHRPLHVDDLARELGVSGRSLRRRFQAALRHSPVREVQIARIEKAKELLGNNRISILDIAQRCGFAESCQLSSFFKKESGITPTEYRSQSVRIEA